MHVAIGFATVLGLLLTSGCAEKGPTCRADDSCEDTDAVAYVNSETGKDGMGCTRELPCKTIGAALKTVPATQQLYVKLHGAFDETVVVEGGHVTFRTDPGTTLTTSKPGMANFTVQGTGTSVKIYGLHFVGQSNGVNAIEVAASSTGVSLLLDQVWISNSLGAGISVHAGSFTMMRSRVEGSSMSGLIITNMATFDVSNSVFFKNGSGGSTSGAVNILVGSKNNRFVLNTLDRNSAGGINCHAVEATLSSNIVSMNGPLGTTSQISGTCSVDHTLTWPGAPYAGDGNFSADPQFVNAPAGDFHLLPSSPAIHAANPTMKLEGPTQQDYDGNLRTNPTASGPFEATPPH